MKVVETGCARLICSPLSEVSIAGGAEDESSVRELA